jgi:GNAT superfamily N-acetyltransferase
MTSIDRHIERSVSIKETPRLLQMQSLFDVPASERSTEKWDVRFELPAEWNIGVIVGPSGSGKTTIAEEVFGERLARDVEWPDDKSVLDAFPSDMGIKEVCAVMSSVGFSSPPSWVRPYRVLSNGEKFRVGIARAMCEHRDLLVVDEFTSVVDRTVAQIGSAAIAKAIRKRGSQFIAVTCHYDVLEWLLPDWVYEPHTGAFSAGRSLQRPPIELEVRRVHHSAWRLFRKHHYLTADLNKASKCFVAFWKGVPVCFCAVLHFPHPTVRNAYRFHRTVCLPDYQGVGIGNAVVEYIGSMFRALGWRALAQLSHPAFMGHMAQSPLWNMYTKPGIEKPPAGKGCTMRGWSQPLRRRLVASFEYVGAPGDINEALKLLQIPRLR